MKAVEVVHVCGACVERPLQFVLPLHKLLDLPTLLRISILKTLDELTQVLFSFDASFLFYHLVLLLPLGHFSLDKLFDVTRDVLRPLDYAKLEVEVLACSLRRL